MSNAEPMSIHERVFHYQKLSPGRALTPRQRRRAQKKDNKNPLLAETYWEGQQAEDVELL